MIRLSTLRCFVMCLFQKFNVLQIGRLYMANREELVVKVINAINDAMLVEDIEVTEKTHLVNDLGADSVDFATMLMQLEEETNIDIPDEELEELSDATVANIVDFLIRLQNKQ